MEIASIVIQILTLIATVFVSFAIYFLGIHNAKILRNKEISENAKKFIRDNESEIDYLELATVAAGCFPNDKHTRKIYNYFIELDDETKQEVLKQRKLKCKLITNGGWINGKISLIQKAIKKLDLGRDFLYDCGKYLHLAYSYKDKKINISAYDEKYDNFFNVRYKITNESKKMPYIKYLDDYLYCKCVKPNLMPKDVPPKPNDYLIDVENFSACDEETLSFWMMVMVSNVLHYSNVYLNWKFLVNREVNYFENETYEDKYFSVLFDLYYLKETK